MITICTQKKLPKGKYIYRPGGIIVDRKTGKELHEEITVNNAAELQALILEAQERGWVLEVGNPYHEPAGKSTGGQFAHAPGYNSLGQPELQDAPDGGTIYAGIHSNEWQTWATDFDGIIAAGEGTLKAGDNDSSGGVFDAKGVKEMKDIYDKVDKASTHNVITGVNVLYRGISMKDGDAVNAAFKRNDIITNKHPTSAAIELHVAQQYADVRNTDNGEGVSVIFKYGSKYREFLGVQAAPMWTPSAEVVLGRGSKYRVANKPRWDDDLKAYIVELYSTDKIDKSIHRHIARIPKLGESYVSEANPYHEPSGSDAGGQFAHAPVSGEWGTVKVTASNAAKLTDKLLMGWDGDRRLVAEQAIADAAEGYEDFHSLTLRGESIAVMAISKESIDNTFVPSEKGNKYVSLSYLATKRSGYGRYAMRRVVSIARDRGQGVFLFAADDAAAGFYEKIGMHRVHEFFYWTPTECKTSGESLVESSVEDEPNNGVFVRVPIRKTRGYLKETVVNSYAELYTLLAESKKNGWLVEVNNYHEPSGTSIGGHFARRPSLPLEEGNPYHVPAGSPAGGQFARAPGNIAFSPTGLGVRERKEWQKTFDATAGKPEDQTELSLFEWNDAEVVRREIILLNADKRKELRVVQDAEMKNLSELCKWQEENLRLRRELGDDHPDTKASTALGDKLVAKGNKLDAKRVELTEQMQAAIDEKLGVDRSRLAPQYDIDISIDNVDKRKQIERGIKEVAAFYQKPLYGYNLPVKFDPNITRAVFVGRYGLKGDTNIGSIVVDKSTGRSTIIHEMGHFLERESGNVHQLAIDFYLRRTKGSTEEPLGDNYEAHETTKRDHFFHPYVGKVYHNRIVSEVVSMGLERYVTHPVEFAREEPEYFRLLYIMMRGGS